MEVVMRQYGVLYAVGALCLLSILLKEISHHTYRRLLKAAGNMGKTDHRLMKMLRVKFDTCYQLKIGVSNVSIFVDKYLGHYRVLGMSMHRLEALSNLCMVLAMLGGICGGIGAMYLQMPASVIYSALCSGVLGNGVVLIFDCMFGNQNLRELLRIDIMDFLENIYKPRLENETFHSQMLEEYRQEYFDGDPAGKVVSLKNSKSGRNPRATNVGNGGDGDSRNAWSNSLEGAAPEPCDLPEEENPYPVEFTKEEEAVIREVIQEYMG